MVLLSGLCLAGLIAVGWLASRLLRDNFEHLERDGLTYGGYAVLAAILIGIVILLFANIENQTPTQVAEQLQLSGLR